MKRFLVDLHIHTLLSPCGELSMSPRTIVRKALSAGLDAIAVCDHNTTLQCPEVMRIGRQEGLTVFCGVELTTREEAHCVVLFPDPDAAAEFQQWIDARILRLPNNPAKLGDQVWVDAYEQIAGEVEWYLNSPVACSIEQAAEQAAHVGALFVPAHVDRPSNSLIGQLGFLPPQLGVAAVEYNHPEPFTALCTLDPTLRAATAYTASDAHFPDQIGSNPSWLEAPHRSFDELRRAFARADSRRIVSRQAEP